MLYREADIAIRAYRPTQLDLVTSHLGEIPLGVFAAKSYFDSRGRPRTLDEFLTHDFVGYDTRPEILQGFRQSGVEVTRDWFPVRCDDHAVYWELLRAGCGLGFAQMPVGRACPEVEEIAMGLPIPTLPVWLTAHEAMRHTPRLRRVWDMLAEGLRPLVA